MTTTDAKRISFFASAIRQLSSLCTLLGNSTAFWFGYAADQTWIHESGPESTLAPRMLHCNLLCIWIYIVTVGFTFRRIIISVLDCLCCFIMLTWLAFHKPSFLFAWVSQTGCGMPLIGWRIPLGVGRKGAGFQVWVTVGRKGSRSCLFALWGGSRGGDLHGGGSCRVLWGHSLLSSHSQLLGLGWVGGRGEKKKISHDVHSSSMLDGLELNGDNEVDPVEYCWVKHCGVAAQHEWMSFKKGTSMLSQTSLDKQRLK